MAMFDRERLVNASGAMYTQGLFYETTNDKSTAIFTLKPFHHEGCVSLRTLFLELVPEDPSEYTFAETVFGDTSYWERLSNSSFLKEQVAEWRRAADVKRKSLAFKAIIEEVKNDGRSKYSAAKFLIDEPWKPSDKATREASKETTRAAVSEFKDDIDRLRDFMN